MLGTATHGGRTKIAEYAVDRNNNNSFSRPSATGNRQQEVCFILRD